METENLVSNPPQGETAPVTEGPFTAPSPQAPVEEAAPVAETPEETPEAPWWHEVASEDDLLGHESLRPKLEERETTSYERGLLEGKGSMMERLDTRDQEVLGAKDAVNRILGRLNKAARDGTLSEDVVDNLLTDHAATLNSLNKIVGEELVGQGQVSAYTDIIGAIAAQAGDSTLASEFDNRLKLHLRGSRDDKFIPDFVKKLTAKAAQEAKAPLEKENAQLKATIEKMKATTRSTGGPNTAPSQASGGSPTYANILKMTSSEIEALPEGALQAAIDKANKEK